MPRPAAGTKSHLKAFADRRRDPGTKREAILLTAAQLFVEKSYRRAGLNDVAERLHITKPALYHYFHNKEDIFLECYRLGVNMILDSLDAIDSAYATGLDKVAAFIESYARTITVDFGRCAMQVNESDLSASAAAEVRGHKRRIDRRLRAFIEGGIEDGSIAACDPKIAAFCIAGAVNWTVMWYRPDGPLEAGQIAAQFARTLTQGLGTIKRSLDKPSE
jgi:AcrR family transcriptional regulator